MDRRSLMLAGLGLAVAAKSAFAQSNAMPMGEAEKTHIRDTLQVGTMSLEASRLAVTHGKDALVKQFANFEVAEQEAIGGLLKPMLEMPPPVDPMQAELMKKLEAAGASFDKDYVHAEIEGHDKLFQIQSAYIAAGKNPTQLAIAKLASGMINEHLALLRDIEKSGVRG